MSLQQIKEAEQIKDMLFCCSVRLVNVSVLQPGICMCKIDKITNHSYWPLFGLGFNTIQQNQIIQLVNATHIIAAHLYCRLVERLSCAVSRLHSIFWSHRDCQLQQNSKQD